MWLYGGILLGVFINDRAETPYFKIWNLILTDVAFSILGDL